VAKALAGGFLRHGHEVMLGTRSPSKLADWAAKNPGARIDGPSKAAAFGELLVLAVKGTAAAQALRAAGGANLAGKPLVDATNPIAESPPVNGVLRFFTSLDEAAKKTVAGIVEQFGWETADMGKAEAARAIEPLCMLWCIPGFLRNDWMHAFKLLGR
jgi:predicted dinucleotide-binding enzyme